MSAPRLVLRSVTIRPDGPPPMKRKVRGREVAGLVYACALCGWESKPITGAPNYARAERSHQCPAGPRLDDDGQAALVGPRFTHRDSDTSEEVVR